MLGNIFDFLFKEVFWRKWLNIVSESKSPVLWKKVFKNTAIKTRTISPDLSIKLASCPSVMRLLLNTFKPDRSVPTAEDFALNIYFELLQNDFHLCNNNQIELWRIRNFASSVRKDWLSSINNSFILKTRFKDIRDRHPSEFMCHSASCKSDFDCVLNNRIELLQNYFQSFNTPDATEKIIIWLPDNSGIVGYDSNDCINVEVSLNASLGADIGFFRVGYDYLLHQHFGEDEWLQIACRDDERALETMQFKSRNIGQLTKHILWAK